MAKVSLFRRKSARGILLKTALYFLSDFFKSFFELLSGRNVQDTETAATTSRRDRTWGTRSPSVRSGAVLVETALFAEVWNALPKVFSTGQGSHFTG